jgi:hypothetical protein
MDVFFELFLAGLFLAFVYGALLFVSRVEEWGFDWFKNHYKRGN